MAIIGEEKGQKKKRNTTTALLTCCTGEERENAPPARGLQQLDTASAQEINPTATGLKDL